MRLICRWFETVFSLSEQPDKAILAYQHANAWQEVFTVAYNSQKSDEEVKELAFEIAGMSLIGSFQHRNVSS